MSLAKNADSREQTEAQFTIETWIVSGTTNTILSPERKNATTFNSEREG